MLDFELTRSSFVPDVPSDAQVWRDWNGVPRAFGWTTGDGEHWIHRPGLASFRFATVGEGVEIIAPDSTPRERVVDSFRRQVVPFILQALGRELLHGSAVETPRGAFAFCGSSGAGKSTLAYALGLRGYPPVADDATAFEVVKGYVQVLRLPFTISPARGLAAVLEAGEARLVEDSSETVENGDPVALAGVFVLERPLDASAGVHELVPLSPADAFPHLLYHGHCFSYGNPQRTQLMVERYLHLAAHVPVRLLRLRLSADMLPAILDEVEQAIS